jgi:NADPH:quinone reductase-like Zn-dependent oxidoreductase
LRTFTCAEDYHQHDNLPAPPKNRSRWLSWRRSKKEALWVFYGLRGAVQAINVLEDEVKAVRLYEYGGPENLKYEDDAPEPTLSADSVLVESSATSVNPIDWKIRSGARQKDFPLNLPAILGKDVSGVVRAVGRNIRTFKPGDRVLAMADATYAELVAVEGSILTHLPEGLNLVDSAAIPLIALTGDQLVRLAARAQSGQTLLVSGALGSVGRAAVHAAKKLGV